MNQHASLNRTYRLIWSEASGAWVPVAETTRGKGKRASRKLVAAALSLGAAVAHAGPTGGQVVAGAGSISQSGNTTTIQQSSQNLSLNWQSFNIGSQETVAFVQPSASAIAVNRIFGNNGTSILGHLDANGQVYLINPNGILFGRGAEVNVGGLVASTLDLSDATLGAAAKSFSGTSSATLINQGTITAANGGYVALLGTHVSNQGVISARLGTVALGAGSDVTLTFEGNSLVRLQVDRSVLNTLAANGGVIQADGGQVIMNAGARDALLASVVNNSGVIEASTTENHAGTITLLGGMSAGTVQVSGTLDASAPDGGNGGAIETSAAHVEVTANATVTTAAARGLTGSWLVDPNDFTVSASGGDITGTALASNLNSTNITLQSSAGATAGSGNINVNDPVSWSANTTLTLTASNNVNVNASLSATGTSAGIAINPNTANGAESASGTGTFNLAMGAAIDLPNVSVASSTALVIGGTPYTVINTLGAAGSTTGTDLQGINGNLSGHFALGSNLDATATSTWNAGAGFTPIGDSGTPFAGTFDGLGHTVTQLTVNLPSTTAVGLFGQVDSVGAVRNVGLIGGSVTGSGSVGDLVGANYGSIRNSYATGSVVATTSSGYSGGLVGINNGTIDGSYAAGNVSGIYIVGGLVGDGNGGSISNSYATGNVTGGTGNHYIGGLVGYESSGTSITASYATGTVSGSSYVGGLIGANYGAVSGSHATGAVIATDSGDYVGGLIGANYHDIDNNYATGSVTSGVNSGSVGGLIGYNSAVISASYATGSVNVGAGSNYTGGLVGYNSSTGSVTAGSFATGSVTGNSYVGGLVGTNYGAISASHSTGSVSGSNYVGGLAGGSVATVDSSYATGNVTGTGNRVGGLVGYAEGSISNSYATGNVSGDGLVGGLIGDNDTATVSITYATGSVSGSNYVGGLVGYNYGTVNASYARGTVTGTSNVGGLAGINDNHTISDSYSAGSVSGTSAVGGLVGSTSNSSTVTHSFWDISTSGQATSAAGLGMTTAQMQQQTNFTSATSANGSVNPSWDFAGTWVMYNGLTDPLLQYFMTPLTVTASNAAKVYDGVAFSGTGGVTLSVTPDSSHLFGTLSYGGGPSGFINAGSYSIIPSGWYSDQQGYNITFVGSATLTIDPRPVNLTGSYVYNGSTAVPSAILSLSNLVAGQSLTLSGSGNVASPNVSAGTQTLNPGTLALGDGAGGGLAANYTFTGGTQTATITPAPLTVIGTTATNKVYDGTTAATLSGGVLSGVISGDSVTLSQSGAFASKNVGTDIAVTANDSVSGASVGNYTFTEPTSLAANITPATLTYTATPVSGLVGQIQTLSGTVSGFVSDDTLANSTAGSLTWSVAGNTTQPGQYAIDGGGLTASNYLFIQAPANATALTLTQSSVSPPSQPPSTVPPPSLPPPTVPPAVLEATAELQSDVLSPGAAINLDTTTAFADTVTLRVISGGLKLPVDASTPTESESEASR